MKIRADDVSRLARRALLTGMLMGCIAIPALGQAQSHGHSHAHVHGLARIDIALDGNQLDIHLDSPLESLIGFEHTPRNESQRKAAETMITRLKDGTQLFRIAPGAQCALVRAVLHAPVLGLTGTETDQKSTSNQGAAPAKQVEHADLSARYRFTCKVPAQASHLDVGLFAATRHLRRIDLQLAVPDGQFKRTLRAPNQRVSLRK